MRVVRGVSLALLAVVLSAGVLWAQVSSSSIGGLVQDATGAVIPGAKVEAKNEATGVVYETTTTSAGTYALSSLPPSQYTITVSLAGFQTFTSLHNVLTVGAPLVVNATLQVGTVAETVEVQATYERIETTHAMLSNVVSRREIVELPLNGRNPLALITLQPGLVQRTGGAAGSGTHVFGSRDRAHNVTVDGIDANESSVPNPQSNLYRLNPDNVQEYRVVTHNATPEFGRNSGANVAVATRSGGNEFHGNVYWFHRNTALNTNEWFNNVEGLEKPVLQLHQFGAEGGGPIKKNKMFFFGSWQGNDIKMTQPISASFGIPTVYTGSLKAGLFRYFIADAANPLVIDGVTITRNSRALVDPKTGALRSDVPVCGGTVTRRCVATYNIFASDPLRVGADPTFAAMVAQFPLPNTYSIGDGLNFGGFNWNPPSKFTGPHFLGRIDHKFNDNNNIFGRFIWSDWDTKEGDFLNSRPQVFPGFGPLGEVRRRSNSLALSYRRVFSPRLVNEFTTGYSRFRFVFLLTEVNRAGGIEPPPYGQECFGTDSLSTIDSPFCNTPHTKRAVSNIQFIDNLSYVRGAHGIRTGFNIRLYRHNDERGVPGGFNMSPTIIFSRLRRSPLSETPPWVIPSTAVMNSTDRNNLQNALVELAGIAGRVQQAFQSDMKNDVYIPDLFTLGTRIKQFNFYVQDEWKLRRNLTMTYGVRWELNLPPSDEGERTLVPDRSVDGSQGPVTYVRAKGWIQRKNWAALAPRISFAWTPWGSKTVIRMGYGIAFDTISTFQATSIGGKVPGSVLLCQVDVQAAAAAPCGDIPNNIRLTALLAAIKPFTLGIPTARPSSQLGPPNRVFGTAPDVGAFDPNLKLPTVHEWSLTIQRELPWSFVGQVGYIGKRGMRLLRAYDLNQLRTDQAGFLQSFLIAQNNMRAGCRPDGTDDPAITGTCTGTAPTLLLQLVPASTLNTFTSEIRQNGLGEVARLIDQRDIVARSFPANYFRPNAQFSEIFYLDSGGDSFYHGFIGQVRRRFEKGLEFGLAYTMSKSMDDMSVDPVAATSGGGLSSTNSRTPTDIRNWRLDRSLSDFDNAHVLTAHAVFDLPLGRGRTWATGLAGWAEHIIGGWSVNGIFMYQSGEPYTINSGIRTANGYKVSRAELIGPKPSGALQAAEGGPVVFQVDDINAQLPNCRKVIGTESFFCIPAPGTSGMGRNTFRGPKFWNFDFGVIKKFDLTERFKLQFRAEFFNLFNHPNFENPRNASTGSPTLTSSLFGQTCCITASVPSSATIVATGEPNRVIQVALKLSF